MQLVRRFADDAGYERLDSRNRLILRFGTRTLLPRRRERRAPQTTASFPLEREASARIDHDERSTPDASPDACVENIVAAVDAFAAGYPQSDDITLLALRAG